MQYNSLPRLAAIPAFLIASLFAGTASAEAINGAIYTSKGDFSVVNANQYPSKPSVYLNGGPSNSNCTGGALDNGDYFFQVTDPSGATLLSEDGIWNRAFRVTNGKVTINLGTHADTSTNVPPTPTTSPCGSLGIQLFPFDTSNNGGGVYKVWITRISDFFAACGVGIDCDLAGFVPGNTKTDNFKVDEPDTPDDDPPPPPPTGSIHAIKFYDANANGAYDYSNDGDPSNDELLLPGWKMTLDSTTIIDSERYTNSATWNALPPGSDYLVTEGTPAETNWVHSATIYTNPGYVGPAQNPAGPLNVVAGQTTEVLFGNYCTIPSNGRTLGFWSNKNGQALIGDDDIAVLIALNLRNADGSGFDPATKGAFKTWLLNGNAVNMAYMLSVQMSAMRLNVYNGFVNGGGYYVPAGMTVNQLVDAANAALGADGYTPAGDANRAYQEQLKNWLDQLNNGAGLLSPTACSFTFP